MDQRIVSISLDPQKPREPVFLGIIETEYGNGLCFASAISNRVELFTYLTEFLSYIYSTPSGATSKTDRTSVLDSWVVHNAFRKLQSGTCSPDMKVRGNLIMFGDQVIAVKAYNNVSFVAVCPVYGLEYVNPQNRSGVKISRMVPWRLYEAFPLRPSLTQAEEGQGYTFVPA
jgi:hypothetical protein